MERISTPEDVRNCYRLLLGRLPEKPQEIVHMVEQGLSQKDLILVFLRSDECRLRFGDIIQIKDDA